MLGMCATRTSRAIPLHAPARGTVPSCPARQTPRSIAGPVDIMDSNAQNLCMYYGQIANPDQIFMTGWSKAAYDHPGPTGTFWPINQSKMFALTILARKTEEKWKVNCLWLLWRVFVQVSMESSVIILQVLGIFWVSQVWIKFGSEFASLVSFG